MTHYKKLYNLLKESCEKEFLDFSSAIKNVEQTQKNKLLNIIRRNENTNFGKEFNFKNINDISDFRNSVPLSYYEDYVKYISLISEGKDNILTKDPVIMLEPTSGSTSASKLIPYTYSLKKEFQSGIFPWLYDLLTKRPQLTNGNFYWSITPASHETKLTSGGIPIGFGNDSSYFTKQQQELIVQLNAVPFEISKIQDIQEFKKQTLHYLTKNKELSFISVWNPTFLSLLLRDIEKPSKLWPNLSLISCWADGNASLYLNQLKNIFPNTEIQGKGLLATEGFVSFPLVDSIGSALSINSHFFEFKKDNNIYLAHELEINNDYEVILTTSGGFYRYNLGDIVEIKGFLNQCPLIKFKGRGNKISDLFGEKLNEYHVEKEIKSLFNETSTLSSFFILAPGINNNGNYCYNLFIETDKDESSLKYLAGKLEERLQDNYHYKYCRKLGQLDNLRLYKIQDSRVASDIYIEEARKKGKKLGNIKSSVFDSSLDWDKILKGRFIN